MVPQQWQWHHHLTSCLHFSAPCVHITVHNALILHVGIFANFDFSPIFPLIFKFQKSLPLKSGGIFPCDLDISFTYQSSTLKPVTLGLTVLLYRYYVLVFFRHVEGSVPKDHYDWYPHCSTVVHLRLSQGGIQNATPTSTWDARKSQA